MTTRHTHAHRTKPVAEKGLDLAKGDRDEGVRLVSRLVRKEVQKRWNRLRKLNNQFRKKLRMQQQLRTDIMELHKAILEVKQEILDNHMELGKRK